MTKKRKRILEGESREKRVIEGVCTVVSWGRWVKDGLIREKGLS